LFQSLSEFNSWFNGIAWGWALIALLVGGGLVLMIFSRLLPFAGFTHALRLTFGKYHHPGDDQDPGQLSHFKALCNALAATIGLGNIAGVAVAITQGGPGAIFWMWVAALIGMNTKFFECTLAVMYRGKDHAGQVQGGPMYVIQNALPVGFKPLAIFFAICGLVGTTAIYTANQTVAYFHTAWAQGSEQAAVTLMGMPRDRLMIGIALAALVTYVLLGGIRRLAGWTSAMVPVMCLFYVSAALVVIALRIDAVPAAFASIFTQAFSPDAVIGGAEGTFVMVLITGIKRAAFSNEAGVGTAPMAHSNAKTTEPISEGLVAMLGPMIDTLIVCTMTALVILVSLEPADYEGRKGVVLTHYAFTQNFGQWGTHGMSIAVALFGFSTMVGMANYNSKCFNYLVRDHLGAAGKWIFLTWFAFTLILGAVASHDDMINLVDTAYGLMAIPTMITTLALAPRVVGALRSYKTKYIGGKAEVGLSQQRTDGSPLMVFGLCVLCASLIYLLLYHVMNYDSDWMGSVQIDMAEIWVLVVLGASSILFGLYARAASKR
jgi:AGCS family alanine or glycine:cation symporter